MESMKKKIDDMPLRRFFILSVLATVGAVILLSGLVIWGCSAFQKYLVPNSESVYLTIKQTYSDGTTVKNVYSLDYGKPAENLPLLKGSGSDSKGVLTSDYSLEKIENSYTELSPKRKLAYEGCSVAMIALPAIFSIIGILLCGFYFYRRKLAKPLRLLSYSTEQVATQNLEFDLDYDCRDEMGLLCESFEQMREALCENNRTLWAMIEERKQLQASVAHDLRNPITIIEGYTEYLEMNLAKGHLSPEKIGSITRNLNTAAKRLAAYTKSVQTVSQLEDMEIHRSRVPVGALVSEITEDFKMISEKENIALQVDNNLTEEVLLLDGTVLHRILENIFSNAMRFAKSKINITFSMEETVLSVVVEDDGAGFHEETLENVSRLILSEMDEDGHMGMGLTVSRLLCKKHGGSLVLANSKTHGGIVKINIGI